MSRSTIFFVLLITFILSSQCTQESGEQGPPPGPPEAVLAMGGLNVDRGLVSKTANATPGYVYFCPLLSDTTYLINMDGEVVHVWDSEYGPSGWLYLKDDGTMARGGRAPNAPVFDGGGQGGILQEINWDGQVTWEYKFASEDHLPHHDVAILPNGNYLTVAWESKTVEEAIQAGRQPELTPKAGLWPDMIVEFQPKGENEAEIVWEWHIWDHLIQDFDSSKDNYGDPASHPELVNINLGGPLPSPVTVEDLDARRAGNNANTNDTPDNQGSDLYHVNAIDYNPQLDQIVFSAPSLDEVFVIDHSTTTEEASGHSGGRWGKGGDILYRWGNPENYNRGDTLDRRLGGQHDVKWIAKGIPGEGHLMVFNNSVPYGKPPHSSVLELVTPISEKGYEIQDGEAFGPADPIWSYVAEDTSSFHSPFISGAHRVANGNTLITEGAKGRYFEVTPDGEVVWNYLTPFAGHARMPDGTFPQPVGPLIYATFRATHVTVDHAALRDLDLSPLSPQPSAYKRGGK